MSYIIAPVVSLCRGSSAVQTHTNNQLRLRRRGHTTAYSCYMYWNVSFTRVCLLPHCGAVSRDLMLFADSCITHSTCFCCIFQSYLTHTRPRMHTKKLPTQQFVLLLQPTVTAVSTTQCNMQLQRTTACNRSMYVLALHCCYYYCYCCCVAAPATSRDTMLRDNS